MAITKIKVINGNLRKSLGQVIDYATNKKKTVAQYDTGELQGFGETVESILLRFTPGIVIARYGLPVHVNPESPNLLQSKRNSR